MTSPVAENRPSIQELLQHEEPQFVKQKNDCTSKGFLKGYGIMFAVASGIGAYLNVKEARTRKRIRFIITIPVLIGGICSFLYVQNNYKKCRKQFFDEVKKYHMEHYGEYNPPDTK